MKNLYKVIGAGILSLPLLLGGYGETNAQSNQKNYFTNWGFIDELKLNVVDGDGNNFTRGLRIADDLEIELGDMDGDGDLDIIVGSKSTGLRIYENRIPQKIKIPN